MNVIIDIPVFEPLLNALKSLTGINIEIIQFPEERSRVLPKELIGNCDAMLCTFPPENYIDMHNLKYLQISSAGFNQVVGKGFEGRNVKVCNALGVFDIPIAEWNISMMINLARDMRSLIRNQESQVWDRSARFQKEIRGSVVGIWGYGGIGRETARLAKALGLKVHVLTRNGIKGRKNIYCVPGTGDPDGTLPDRVFYMAEKEEFLKSIDFLVMAIPHTASNEGIVGEPELKMLHPGAFLLNPARGLLIQETALLKALREGWIAGAALDTHYYYPMPPEHPLWYMPNVIMTPHVSGSSASPRFLERVWDIFIQNILRFQQRQPLLNELSSSDLKGELISED